MTNSASQGPAGPPGERGEAGPIGEPVSWTLRIQICYNLEQTFLRRDRKETQERKATEATQQP